MKKAENREVAAHILNCLRQHKTVKKNNIYEFFV